MCVRFAQGSAGFVPQGSNYARDLARAPLFKYVNEDKLRSIETYLRKNQFITTPLLPSHPRLKKHLHSKHAVFFKCRFRQPAGQLRIVHRRVREGDVRGASREQALYRFHDGDRCHEGAVAGREIHSPTFITLLCLTV